MSIKKKRKRNTIRSLKLVYSIVLLHGHVSNDPMLPTDDCRKLYKAEVVWFLKWNLAVGHRAWNEKQTNVEYPKRFVLILVFHWPVQQWSILKMSKVSVSLCIGQCDVTAKIHVLYMHRRLVHINYALLFFSPLFSNDKDWMFAFSLLLSYSLIFASFYRSTSSCIQLIFFNLSVLNVSNEIQYRCVNKKSTVVRKKNQVFHNMWLCHRSTVRMMKLFFFDLKNHEIKVWSMD